MLLSISLGQDMHICQVNSFSWSQNSNYVILKFLLKFQLAVIVAPVSGPVDCSMTPAYHLIRVMVSLSIVHYLQTEGNAI